LLNDFHLQIVILKRLEVIIVVEGVVDGSPVEVRQVGALTEVASLA
jgi:hypothetical protein